MTRMGIGLLGLLCLSAFSSAARRRLAERMGLFLWHLRGRPEDEGLASALLADGARFNVADVGEVTGCGDVA